MIGQTQEIKLGVNPDTTNIFGEYAPSVKIDSDSSLAIIQSVKTENNFIRDSLSKASEDLKRLSHLTARLLNQNQNLREHNYYRKQDLEQLIFTIKQNLNEQFNDLQHRVHLLKQANCLIFKSIQSKNAGLGELQNRTADLERKFTELNNELVYSREHVLNPLKVRLQTKLNSQHAQQLQHKIQRVSRKEKELLDEIMELSHQARDLKKQSIQNMHVQRNIQEANTKDKGLYKNNIITSIESLQQIKAEVAQLTQALIKAEERNRQTSKKYREGQEKYQSQHQNKEKKSSQLSKLYFERQNLVKMVKDTSKRISELQIQQMNKNDERDALIKKITNKKRAISQLQNEFTAKKIKLSEGAAQQISQCKTQIDQRELSYSEQSRKIAIESQKCEKQAEELELYLKDLNKGYASYESMLKKLHNPVEQISRIQLSLDTQGKRQALGILTNQI